MKILHTSDWHIGKLVHGLYMTEDQKVVLEQMKDIIISEKVDVLIVAGDLYDRSIPPTHAVELVNETLTALITELHIQVIIISGNHDSPDRLDFGAQMLRNQGLHIIGQLPKEIKPIVLEDGYGFVNFYPIPYAEPALVKALYNENVSDHESSVAVLLNQLDKNDLERNVCIAHQFVTGTELPDTSDSERTLSIGGTDQVSVELFKDFDYVALGHLHRPQKIKYEHVRYGGSLLKYSFSEATQKKNFTLVTLNEKHQVDIKLIPVEPRRDLRIIKGKLEDLLSEDLSLLASREDYISAVLTDEGQNFEPMKRLKAVYPNILQIEKERKSIQQQDNIQSLKTLSPLELVNAFYEQVTGEKMNKSEEDLYKEAYDFVLKEERSDQ
ncbi:MAG: exonuclease SbcCD subunit D [Clostridia bacterium]|nr:exonuclease SbcCD subunit D [Clostridia bacterium]